MRSNRTVLAAALAAAVMLAACNRDAAPAPAGAAPDVVTAPDAAPAVPAQEAPAPEPAGQSAATPPQDVAPFDVTGVAVSSGDLGEWPYIAAPEGYEFRSARTLDLSQVPFWTGQALQPVEGKVFEARIRETGEKSYSRFEVLKRLDQALTALGAQKITTSEVPRDVISEQLPKNFGVEFNAGAGGYYGDEEISTYVLRQADRVVWYKIYSDGNGGSVLIAESEDVPPPAA